MKRADVPRSWRSPFLIEISLYVSATRSTRLYPFGRLTKNFHGNYKGSFRKLGNLERTFFLNNPYVCGSYVIVLITATGSTTSTDGFYFLIAITDVGGFGGFLVFFKITFISLLLEA